jgi:hypothetical protein
LIRLDASAVLQGCNPAPVLRHRSSIKHGMGAQKCDAVPLRDSLPKFKDFTAPFGGSAR